jgi:hypothetical protein
MVHARVSPPKRKPRLDALPEEPTPVSGKHALLQLPYRLSGGVRPLLGILQKYETSHQAGITIGEIKRHVRRMLKREVVRIECRVSFSVVSFRFTFRRDVHDYLMRDMVAVPGEHWEWRELGGELCESRSNRLLTAVGTRNCVYDYPLRHPLRSREALARLAAIRGRLDSVRLYNLQSRQSLMGTNCLINCLIEERVTTGKWRPLCDRRDWRRREAATVPE